jgi:hypothetical protein
VSIKGEKAQDNDRRDVKCSSCCATANLFQRYRVQVLSYAFSCYATSFSWRGGQSGRYNIMHMPHSWISLVFSKPMTRTSVVLTQAPVSLASRCSKRCIRLYATAKKLSAATDQHCPDSEIDIDLHQSRWRAEHCRTSALSLIGLYLMITS